MEFLSNEKIKEYFLSNGTVSRWWDQDDNLYTYHYQNQFLALSSYISMFENKNVLDVGTGKGRFAIWFAKLNCNVHAVDISEEMLDMAVSKAKKEGVSDKILFYRGDAEELTEFQNEFYDIVCCISTFDHIPNLDRAVEKMANKLKPGGIFIYNYCPNGSLYGLFFRLYAGFISRFYRLGEEEKLVARLYGEKELKRVFNKNGITIIKRWGIGLLSFPLRQEFENGWLAPVCFSLRAVNRLEEKIFPFYNYTPIANRCHLVIGVGKKITR